MSESDFPITADGRTRHVLNTMLERVSVSNFLIEIDNIGLLSVLKFGKQGAVNGAYELSIKSVDTIVN